MQVRFAIVKAHASSEAPADKVFCSSLLRVAMKLLIFPAIDEQRLKRIAEAAPSIEIINTSESSDAERAVVNADAFFGKISPSLLRAACALKWVQSPSASLEHYVFPELIEHPCVLSNMRGLFYDVVADHAMTFVLCFARNMHHYVRRQMQHEWKPVGAADHKVDFVTGPGTVSAVERAHLHVQDCTMGIVGVGSIGAEIGRRAAAFGMRVVGIDPHCRSIQGVTDRVLPVERLPEILRASDFVAIAAPHTPQTERLFRREQFAAMKSSSYLINVGRGAIVDLHDLTEAIGAGEIAGAGLDVFEEEPLPASHPLWSMENVIITPHIASASPRIAERHTQTLVENIRRFAQGKPPLTQVDKRLWY